MIRTKQALWVGCVLSLLTLTACGGSGSSSRVGPTDTNNPPTVSDPGPLVIVANEISAPVTLTVADNEDVGGVVLSAESSDQDLLPAAQVVFSGDGADRSFTVAPANGQIGSATLTITATDGGGLLDSIAINVTVEQQPTLFAQFFRSVFAGEENAAPLELNSRAFTNDAAEGDFDDLIPL